MSTEPTDSTPTEHRVSRDTVTELLDKPAAPTEVERADGLDGMEAARANARLVDADEQAAEVRADVKRRDPAPAAKGRTVHEQVVADLLNRSTTRARVRPLDDAYQLALDVAVALRSLINDVDAQPVPETPVIRLGYVHVDDAGVAWQWRENGWNPITTLDGLDAATIAAIEEHTGPLNLPAARAGTTNGARA